MIKIRFYLFPPFMAKYMAAAVGLILKVHGEHSYYLQARAKRFPASLSHPTAVNCRRKPMHGPSAHKEAPSLTLQETLLHDRVHTVQ